MPIESDFEFCLLSKIELILRTLLKSQRVKNFEIRSFI